MEQQYEKLIWSVVHKLLSIYNGIFYYEGLEEDLFQEGYLGLLLAKQKYDKEQDVKFTTFAYKYIYGYCMNFLKKDFKSLNYDDIDDCPISSNQEIYDEEEVLKRNIFQEINKQLHIVNKTIPPIEKNILMDKMNGYSFRECAERNNCSTQKVTNTINKYKDVIKNLLN